MRIYLAARFDRGHEMRTIAGWIGEVLAKPEDTATQERVRGKVRELCHQFPAPTNHETE